MLFTPEQLFEIRKIIEDYHDAFIVNAFGEEALSPEVVDRLRDKGLVDVEIASIKDSYVYGQLMGTLQNKATAKMGYGEFKNYIKKNPVPLSAPEQAAMQVAAITAGQYCKGLGNRVASNAVDILIDVDQDLRAQFEEDIQDATAQNIMKRESISQLESDLGWRTADWARDLKRIAITEKNDAMQKGTADHFHKRYGGDAWVFKRRMPDSCEHCRELYEGPDGHPRIFRLSVLEGNGTNVGRKTQAWLAVIGSTHPHCQCVLGRVPDGWGFNEDGDLVPGGEFGKKYETEEQLALSLLQESDLRKAWKLQGETTYQGIPVAIENKKGSIRRWRGGETEMKVSYGYVKKTEGMDGDEIDVFLGPVKDAEEVFIIEQMDPGTGIYDEQKCMLGFYSEKDAVDCYFEHYDTPESFFLDVTPMSVDHFKRWVDGTLPRPGEMTKAADLEKAGQIGGKYTKRVPYTDKHGKRKYRYYYAESAVTRDVVAGETIKLGKQFVTVESVGDDGTIYLKTEGKTLAIKADKWDKLLAAYYGESYYKWAEKRAQQSVNAVLRHVPKEHLGDLKGATDKERLADLKKRVPEVYDKLRKSFSRAGVNPFRAKQILGATLERKGWEPEARAAVIGDVITKRNQDYRSTIQAAENLAGGGPVQVGHVGAVSELVQQIKDPGTDAIAEVAAKAEAELAKLSALLAKAKTGSSEDAARALAGALSSTAIHKLNMIAQAFPGVVDKAVEPSREVMLEAPSVAPVQAPKELGSKTTVFVAGEGGKPKALTAQYKIMEADEAIASHDPRSFNQRKDYPEGVQERAYHRDVAEQAKVQRNAQRMRPEFVVNTNPDAVNGPPIMGPDGVVLGGNSRTMSIQLAYANHPEKAQEMRSYLSEHAHEVGFTEEDIAKFKSPILVRVIDHGGDNKVEKQLLVRQMNESFTQGMDPRTMQVAMGRKITDETLEALGNAMEPDETLNAFLATNRAESFVNALTKVGIIDQRNSNQYFLKGTKKLNDDGRTLVARVLVGRMVGDADLLSATKSSIIENLARSAPYIAQAKVYGQGYDLKDDVKIALDAYNSLQYRVDTKALPALKADMPTKMFAQLFDQQEMFGEAHPVTQNPRAMGMLEILIRKPGTTQITKLFKDYADRAARNPEGQASILGPVKTPNEIFTDVVADSLGKTKPKEEAPPPEPEKDTDTGSLFMAVKPGDLEKGGPYIGPRGGKWADAKHTIPWQEPKRMVVRTPVKQESPAQLALFGTDTESIVQNDPALSDEQKAKPVSAALKSLTSNIEEKVNDPEEWELPPGARIDDPWKAPSIDPEATWEHPDYGSGKGQAPWQGDIDWKPDFNEYSHILVNSSGGKDSQAQLTAIVEHADKIGYPRKNIIVIHADLGRVEWEGSKSIAEKQAEFYGVTFKVVRRTQNDLIDQIDERHGDLVQREVDTATLVEAGVRTWGELAKVSEGRVLSLIGDGKGTSKWGGEHRAKQLIKAGQKKLERDVVRHESKVEKAKGKVDKAKASMESAKTDPQQQKARVKYNKAVASFDALNEKGSPETWPIDFGLSIPWPSMDARFCTSDHKRAEIKKFMTVLSKEHIAEHGKGSKPRILNTLGIRAQESPGRAKMDNFTREEETRTKTVDRWYPIHRWPEKKVWDTIRDSKVPFHRAYKLGMRRLSCCFCVFATKEDLMIAAVHNPDLFKTYLTLEEKVGVNFTPQLSLKSVAEEIEKRRSEGYDLNTQAEWVKKALACTLDIDLVKSALEADPIEPGLVGLLLEAALIRLQRGSQEIGTVVLDWKEKGVCVHLDTAVDSHHVAFLGYPAAYNASMSVAVFARRHGFPLEEHNAPGPMPVDEDLEKGGPYIGPRGGKWADPDHTIPWSEEKPKRAPKKKPNKKEWDKGWQEGDAGVHGFVTAGSPNAIEALGPHESVNCARCGSGIQDVFLTDKGPIGGDCLATVTGDNSTRKAFKKAIKSFGYIKERHDFGRYEKLEVESKVRGFDKGVVVRAHYIKKDPIIEEYSGEYYESSKNSSHVITLPEAQAPIALAIASHLAESANGLKIENKIEHLLEKAEIPTWKGGATSPAGNRAPGPGLGVNYFIPVPKKKKRNIKDDSFMNIREFGDKPEDFAVGALHTTKEEYYFQHPTSFLKPIEIPEDYTAMHEAAREGVEANRDWTERYYQSILGPVKNTVELEKPKRTPEKIKRDPK